MQVEFRAAVLPDEIPALVRLDHRIFPKADWFPPSFWKEYESYWLLVDGKRIGCSAFGLRFDDDEELLPKGSLYIASTGILPSYQGRGFGRLMKAWQLAYARDHGFDRMITLTRGKNRRMLQLNRDFGFEVVRKIARYYQGPSDTAVVMELRFR